MNNEQFLADALETAWGIIANVSGGDWDKQSKEWQNAATRWRDEAWHAWLDKTTPDNGASQESD